MDGEAVVTPATEGEHRREKQLRHGAPPGGSVPETTPAGQARHIDAGLVADPRAESGTLAPMVLLVTPADMLGWSCVEEVAVGAGTMEEGPGAPPSGTGSAALVVDGEGREVLASSAYVGTRFADISTLRYFTWQDADSPGSDIYAVSLQFDVDYDLDDADPSTASRLVYEPYYLGGVVKGEWQAWDTMDGLWWAVKEPGLSLCPQSAPCTWDEVVLAFPSAGSGGEVGLRAGGGLARARRPGSRARGAPREARSWSTAPTSASAWPSRTAPGRSRAT